VRAAIRRRRNIRARSNQETQRGSNNTSQRTADGIGLEIVPACPASLNGDEQPSTAIDRRLQNGDVRVRNRLLTIFANARKEQPLVNAPSRHDAPLWTSATTRRAEQDKIIQTMQPKKIVTPPPGSPTANGCRGTLEKRRAASPESTSPKRVKHDDRRILP